MSSVFINDFIHFIFPEIQCPENNIKDKKNSTAELKTVPV